jgi:CRISPR/Cas system CSM-associated protein Csm2 small subunit
MDQVNVDNRMAAAIENSKKFMDMDLKNLDNDQQTEVLNTQNRVQSILEDAKAVNAQRLFTADSQNEMGKFYDQLNSSIGQFNASQTNNMAQFNTDQTNAQSRFNADLENNREQFYKTMQYNIDVSNVKWRRDVTLANADMKFQAAATDVKNLIGIQQEALNQLWDRSDALLDYMFKSTENQKDRDATLGITKMQLDAKDKEGLGAMFGSVLGTGAESLFSNLFGGSGIFK